MRISSLLPLPIILCLLQIGAPIPAAWADTAQPSNLSCISERPLPNQRVLRDCDKTPAPTPVVIPEPYQTPSQIPLFQHHDSGSKGGQQRGGNESDQGGRANPNR